MAAPIKQQLSSAKGPDQDRLVNMERTQKQIMPLAVCIMAAAHSLAFMQ